MTDQKAFFGIFFLKVKKSLKFINFNNAGSSFVSKNVNNSIYKYLRYEEKYGGYYAADKFNCKLDAFYKNLSILINCKKRSDFISSKHNVCMEYFSKFSKFSEKKNIVILDNEYGSNLIYYKKEI